MSRFFATILVVLAVFISSRAIVRALPGDPVDTLIAESGTAIPREALLKQMGLDRPFFQATREDLQRALHGDLGISLSSKQPVSILLKKRFFNTAELAITAFILAIFLSISVGLFAAQKAGGRADHICNAVTALSASLPTPWIGPVLIIVFAIWVPLFQLGDSLALPSVTLALGLSGFWARLIRDRVRETLHRGSAQGARARGIPEWKVVVKYGLAPTSGMLFAYFGTQLGSLLSGAFVTEVIFNWKGLGSLLVSAVLRRDYPVVEAATFVAAATAVLGTALGDWARTRIERREEYRL